MFRRFSAMRSVPVAVVWSTLVAAGCSAKDDGGGSCTGDDCDGASDATGDGAATGSSTSGTAGGSGGSGAETSTGDGSTTGSTTLGTTATSGDGVLSISGSVVDLVLGTAIPDLPVALYGDPAFATVTDPAGEFRFDDVPPGLEDFIVAADSEMYWGTVAPVFVDDSDVQVEVLQIQKGYLDTQFDRLQGQDPNVDLDETKGGIIGLANTIEVTVDLTPPPMPGQYFAPDAYGNPWLNQNETAWVLVPYVAFFNLEPGPPDTFRVDARHVEPALACTIAAPSPPTIALHVSLVEIECL